MTLRRRVERLERMSRVSWNFGWRPASGDVLVIALLIDRLGMNLALQGGAQGRQVQVAVHTAELLLRLEHAGGAPPERHLAALPALDVGGVLTADGEHALDGVCAAHGADQRRRQAQAGDGQGLG